MNLIFDELFTTEGIQGVLSFTPEGSLIFSRFVSPLIGEIDGAKKVSTLSGSIDWSLLSQVLGEAEETEIIFDKRRIYIKKITNGYLFIIMGNFIPIAMVRLNCEIIIPELEKIKKQSGFARFFGL